MQPAVLVGDTRGRRSGPGPGSRRPGSAGGWSAAAAPPSRACARGLRRARASSPARRSRSGRRSGPRSRRARSPPRAPRRAPARRRRGPRAAAAGRRPASSSRASCVGTTEIRVTPSPSSDARDPVDVEAVVDDRGGPVDDAAHDDREAADVEQRQAAEPAVGRLDAEVEGRADRAPEMVAVGEPDRRAGRPRCRWSGCGSGAPSRSCSPSSGRSASVVPRSGEPLTVSTGPARASSALELGLGQPGVDRVGDRAQLHQRVQEDDVLEPGRQRQRHGRPAARAARRQAARRGGRLALELGVGERRLRRRSERSDRGRSAARWESQLSRFIGERRKLRKARLWHCCHPCRPRTRTPRRASSSTRRSSGARPPSTRTSSTSGPRRSRGSRSTGPRSATPSGRRRWPSCATPSPAPATTPSVGAIIFTGAGDRGLLLRRRPADPRRRRLHRRRRGRRSRASAGSTSATCTCRSAGCRSRCSRRSPATRSAAARSCTWSATSRSPPTTRVFGQTGPARRQLRRRLRRRPAGARGRRPQGEGDLVPLPPLRRRRGARDGARERGRRRSPSSSASRSPGAAR